MIQQYDWNVTKLGTFKTSVNELQGQLRMAETNHILFHYSSLELNRPFLSSRVPLFQNESKCETFYTKMSSACSFIFMKIRP